jgi:hypothetical protein
MASPYDLMTNTNRPGGITTTRSKQTERRSGRRCKITQLMRIRPSDPERDHFDDIRGSMSVSRTGVYFQSSVATYEVGMRLFVTMPYSKEPASMSHEYLAEVVRRDPLPNGLVGVGFKILMEMGLQNAFGSAYSNNQR